VSNVGAMITRGNITGIMREFLQQKTVKNGMLSFYVMNFIA